MSGSDSYVWGPVAWAKFHQTALSFCQPVHHMDQVIQFYTQSFLRYIKCETCRTEYKHIIQSIPPDCSSGAALFNWTVTVHNIVNGKLGKPLISTAMARSIWCDTDYDDDDYDYVFSFRI